MMTDNSSSNNIANDNSLPLRGVGPIIPGAIIKGTEFNDREAPVSPEMLIENNTIQQEATVSEQESSEN
jgi:hypothetical protein